MERIAMNQEERDWLEWLKRVQDGVVTQRQAAGKMGVSDRWVRKLLLRMKSDGDAVVVHGLEGRGDVGYLVSWMNDATSRSGGRFVLHDGTRENMGVLWQYVGCNGRMVDLYTDRAGIFTVAPRAKESAQRRQEADRLTQFDRGLREL